jgi:hypothetical protein
LKNFENRFAAFTGRKHGTWRLSPAARP